MDEHTQPADQRKNPWLALTIVLIVAVAVGAAVLLAAQYALQNYLEVDSSLDSTTTPAAKSTETPQFSAETALAGLDRPWDFVFLPDNQLLFTERKGTVSVMREGKRQQIAKIPDVYAQGEGGLLGMALDPAFTENHYLYTCFNAAKDPSNLSKGPIDIRVVRWKLNTGLTALEDRKDIVAGIPANQSGRHSGCRLAFGPDGHLWIGTGDAALHTTPQDPKGLGGKILRVTRDGVGVADNMGGNFDARVYSYGHRNTQGIAFPRNPVAGTIGYSVEHGTNADDEVNPLKKGNFGWAPSGYSTAQETASSMTDKQKFPDAIEPVWKSGNPAQAPSGANFIYGQSWKGWDGALAIAMLNTKHLKVLTFDAAGKVAKEERAELNKGRLRMVRQGPDGNLYVSTDNGKDSDEILRLVPKRQ